MDFSNVKGVNSYFQTLAAGGGLAGGYLLGEYFPVNSMVGSYLYGTGLLGGYPLGLLAGATTSAAAPTYAKFMDALEKAVDEKQGWSEETKEEVQELLKKSYRTQFPYYSLYTGSQSGGDSTDSTDQVKTQWNLQQGQRSSSGQSGRQGSLAYRLAASRAARQQERMAERESRVSLEVRL